MGKIVKRIFVPKHFSPTLFWEMRDIDFLMQVQSNFVSVQYLISL
jgi:hypothetical protein